MAEAIARAAAKGGDGEPGGDDGPTESPPGAPEEPRGEAPIDETPAAKRKAFLDQHKMLRQANEATARARREQATAREMSERATAFDASIRDWRKNPTAPLIAAGIDPKEFINHFVEHALHNDPPPGPDPVVEKVTEAIQPYLQEMERERAQQTQHREMVEEANYIARGLLPALKPDSHEALLAVHDDDPIMAATYVYRSAKEHYEATGEVVPLPEAARRLEEFHAKQYEAAFQRGSRMKRFQQHFVPEQQRQQHQPQRTLTNNQNAGTQYSSNGNGRPMSRLEAAELAAMERQAGRR